MENKDHKYFYLYVDGVQTSIRTKTSHNNQEIDDYLIRQMSKQLGLTKKLFCDLIDCPLSKEEYVNILIDKGILK